MTSVVTYDRCGLGVSPVCRDGRGVAALATDLGNVIRLACAGGPAVIVGHSLGATVARYLAAIRPDLVAGMVLIDPIPDVWIVRHAGWAAPFGRIGFQAMECLAHLRLIDVAMAMPGLRGVTRSSTSPQAVLSDATRDVLAAEMRRPQSHRTARREFDGLLRSRVEVRAMIADPTVPMPLTVISGGQTHRLATHLRRFATDWHARLVDAGVDGRHVIVDNGGHCIPRYRPDVVADVTAELLGRLAPRRFDQHSISV